MRRIVVEWSVNEAIKKIKDREIERLKTSETGDNSELINKAQFTLQARNLEKN